MQLRLLNFCQFLPVSTGSSHYPGKNAVCHVSHAVSVWHMYAWRHSLVPCICVITEAQ